MRYSRLLYMQYLLCITFMVLAFSGDGMASDGADTAFRNANALYESGKYEEALSIYKDAADGVESGNLYYNIGNCYFKLKSLAEAVLYYERAKRLIPGDKDLESNLAYAKSLVENVGQESNVPWYLAVIENFSARSSAGRLTLFAELLYIAFTLLALTWILSPAARRFIFYPAAICAIIFLFSSSSLARKIYVYERLRPSVVLDESQVRYGPSEGSTEYFRLFEGNEVYILKSRPGWYFIRRPDGRKGWIKSGSLEII